MSETPVIVMPNFVVEDTGQHEIFDEGKESHYSGHAPVDFADRDLNRCWLLVPLLPVQTCRIRYFPVSGLIHKDDRFQADQVLRWNPPEQPLKSGLNLNGRNGRMVLAAILDTYAHPGGGAVLQLESLM
jgi:hypothetical protein